MKKQLKIVVLAKQVPDTRNVGKDAMTPAAEQLLRASYETLGLSARAHDRILRVARTIADLSGKRLLDEDSLLEALQYRAQEKVDLTF